jgi:molecular chaperone DnaK (HSP70)
MNLNFVIVESFLKEIETLVSEQTSADELVTKSNKIDQLIDELMAFKKGLKRGPERFKYRKEAHNLQNAIQTLRYLRKKNNKLIDELNKED